MYIDTEKLSISDRTVITAYGIIRHFSDWLDKKSRIAILQMDGTQEKYDRAVDSIQAQIKYLESKKKKSPKVALIVGDQCMLRTVLFSIEEIDPSKS